MGDDAREVWQERSSSSEQGTTETEIEDGLDAPTTYWPYPRSFA